MEYPVSQIYSRIARLVIKYPPIFSHIKRISARMTALLPTPLNLSILVSIPRAVIAMVRIKVSMDFITPVISPGRRLKELNPATARNHMANQGIDIFDLIFFLFCRGFYSFYKSTQDKQKGNHQHNADHFNNNCGACCLC